MSYDGSLLAEIQPVNISTILIILDSGRTVTLAGADAVDFWEYMRLLYETEVAYTDEQLS